MCHLLNFEQIRWKDIEQNMFFHFSKTVIVEKQSLLSILDGKETDLYDSTRTLNTHKLNSHDQH